MCSALTRAVSFAGVAVGCVSAGISAAEACASACSLGGWSSGMKLCSVTARATSGKAASRAALSRAACSDGASTLTSSVPACGASCSASSVAIDSDCGSFRCSGSKSKRSCGSSGAPARMASSVTSSTGLR
ncbi:hypothetical protein D9M72_527240 [compost metagenome]